MLSELDNIFTSETVDEQLNYSKTIYEINTCLCTLNMSVQAALVQRYFAGDSIQEVSRLPNAT